MQPEGRAPAIVPLLIEAGREVIKAVAAAHGLIDTKCRRIEKVVFEVVGLLGIDVVKGLVLFEGSSKAKTTLIALVAVLYEVSAEVALGKLRFAVNHRTRAADHKGFSPKFVATRVAHHINDPVATESVLGRIVVGIYRDVAYHPHGNGKLHSSEKLLVVVHSVNEIIGIKPVGSVDADKGSFGIKARRLHHRGQAEKRSADIAPFYGQLAQLAACEPGGDLGIAGVDVAGIGGTDLGHRQFMFLLADQSDLNASFVRAQQVNIPYFFSEIFFRFGNADPVVVSLGQSFENHFSACIAPKADLQPDARICQSDFHAFEGFSSGQIAHEHFQVRLGPDEEHGKKEDGK